MTTNIEVQFTQEFISNLLLIIQIMKLQYFYLTAIVYLMSLLLLPDSEIDSIVLKKYQFYKEKSLNYRRPQLTEKQEINFQEEIKKIGECSQQLIRQNHESKELVATVGTTLQNYKNLISISINKTTRHIRIKMNLITPQQSYFQVYNSRSISHLSVKVKKFLKNRNLDLTQISFNMANGKFRMMFPLYTGSQAYFQGVLSKGQSLIEYIFKTYLERNFSLLQFIVKEGNQQFSVESGSKAAFLDSALRYLDITNTKSLITDSTSIPEEEIMEIERRKKFDFDQLMKNRIKVNETLLMSNQLYEIDSFQKFYGAFKTCSDFTNAEEKVIISKISMPIQHKPKSTAQNLLILNYVYVCDLAALRLKKIDEGGFSSIYLTDMKYLCVYPTPGYETLRFNQVDLSNHKNVLHKRVIIKKEDEGCGFSRNRHEVEILKSMKDPSIFLPKYYIILNKPNPYNNAVVMDYIPHQNLTQYMALHTRSMSLRSKLIIIFSTIQALRFLRDQRIVHLDLKPSNIMVNNGCMVKLIDFGESYQPEVCSKKHKPGFSIPYSSPEIFNSQTKVFTSKSDVFSLGVIMFQVLYRSYPYDIFEDTEIIDEIMANYLKKWLFAPEEFEKYGDIKILRIMNVCISKCLSPQISNRPELDWLAIILRCCIQYIE